MKVSIAMATYNGALHLQEQLDSIAAQKLAPHELVICDDGSSDSSLDIIRAFAATHQRILVRVYNNDVRLGYAENFSKAIQLCTGDLIFLSDQDDVWFPHKIEVIAGYFSNNPEIWLSVNDAELTDAMLNPSGLTILSQLERAGFGEEDHIFGCCMALRRELIEYFNPVPRDFVGHDGWLSVLAASFGVRGSYRVPLQFYRRHGGNVSSGMIVGLRPSSRWLNFRAKMEQFKAVDPKEASRVRLVVLEELEARLRRDSDKLKRVLPTPAVLSKVMSENHYLIQLNKERMSLQNLHPARRLLAALKFAASGKYVKFEGVRSLLRDIFG